MRPSRRALVIAAPVAAAGAVAAGLVAGGVGRSSTADGPGAAEPTTPSAARRAGPESTAHGAASPVAASPEPATGPAVVTATTFTSAARGRPVTMVTVTPAGGGRGLPVCLVLHGRGDDARRAVGLLGLDGLLPAAIGAGVAPFALVTVDGGTTYWHRRAAGDDPEAMILDEIRPRLATAGLRTARMAALGWSMGGYGALLLARRHPDLVVAAAASSPAMWRSYGASAPGAFDSAADFAAHRILGTAPAPGVAYRIDCGDDDPFAAVSRQAVADLRPQEHSLGPGGHTPTYWRAVAPAQLAFVGAALHRSA
ncbi:MULTISPECIES: alpha/beta hydrolase-fold protein [Frankia]|uniref:alpha/beta hydrolase-fold protein n=1 Tax=Frankia TaxID=1854 RepID=UPI000695D0CA|nr:MULTISPECIES: alpha/beta hydrolase-fold protein [Frankia]